jgi:hypothetical protein
MHWAVKTGQITPFLAGGTILVVYLLRKGLSTAAGLLLSVVAWVKLFPTIFVLVFFLRKDYWAVIWFIIGCVSIFLFGSAIFGLKVLGQYVSILNAITSGINICWINQSFESFYQRFYVDLNLANRFLMMSANADVILFAVLSKIFIFLLVLRFMQLSLKEQCEEYFLLSTYALMGLMVLLVPVSWVHYYIFFIPLAIVVVRAIFSQKIQIKLPWVLCYGISAFSLFIGCGILTVAAQQIVNIFGSAAGNDILKMFFGLHLIGGVFLLFVAYGVLKHPSKPLIP